MGVVASVLTLTMFVASTSVVACANDTLRAQSPTTTTGPYNTGTTATPGLSAGAASRAHGEGGGRPVGPIAPAASAPAASAGLPTPAP